MAEPLTAEHFRPHLNKVFRVHGGRHGLTLAAVQAGSLPESDGNAVARQPFTLIFSGPRDDVLREGLYTLEVEGPSSFELYVMPVHTPAGDRQDYQAAFN